MHLRNAHHDQRELALFISPNIASAVHASSLIPYNIRMYYSTLPSLLLCLHSPICCPFFLALQNHFCFVVHMNQTSHTKLLIISLAFALQERIRDLVAAVYGRY